MYRHEESGTSYDIRVKGQETDDAVKELLDGIVLKLEDEGNKDAPWPWEGEPLEPVLAEQMVGSYTIVPEYIPFKEAQGVMQIMEHQFVKQGDQVFHLLGNKLDTYNYQKADSNSFLRWNWRRIVNICLRTAVGCYIFHREFKK